VITFHETFPRWSKPEAVLNFDHSSSDTPLSTAEEGQTGGGAVLICIGIAFQLSLIAPCREINWVIGKIFSAKPCHRRFSRCDGFAPITARRFGGRQIGRRINEQALGFGAPHSKSTICGR
jgi:hypothetical protein